MQWAGLIIRRESEVKGMAERIISMRDALYNSLTHEHNTPGEWGHIKSQIGMFRCANIHTSRDSGLIVVCLAASRVSTPPRPRRWRRRATST